MIVEHKVNIHSLEECRELKDTTQAGQSRLHSEGCGVPVYKRWMSSMRFNFSARRELFTLFIRSLTLNPLGSTSWSIFVFEESRFVPSRKGIGPGMILVAIPTVAVQEDCVNSETSLCLNPSHH